MGKIIPLALFMDLGKMTCGLRGFNKLGFKGKL